MNPKEKTMLDIDRISDLPDPILCKIVSYLPTKNAIATSVLSTRWKTISPFDYPPIHLHLDSTLLLRPLKFQDELHSPSEERFADKLFKNTLSDVSYIESMYLHCVNGYLFNSWIKNALRINIKHLVLFVSRYSASSSYLFQCLDGCTSLSTLVVQYEHKSSLVIDDNFCLPNLKKLEIRNIYLVDTNFYKLFSGCPALEELVIGENCSIVTDDLCMTSHSLKKLEFIDCYLRYKLTFRVPNLKELKARSAPSINYSICNVTSLHRAVIDVFYPSNVIAFFIACSTTTSLCLAARSVFGLRDTPMQLVLQNLTHLSFSCLKMPQGLEISARLLWIAPKLKKLILDKGNDSAEAEYERFERLMPKAPVCLELHLKEIEVLMFEDSEDEVKLMDYFLNNGKVLEKLVLHCPYFEDWSIMNGSHMFRRHPKVFYEPIRKICAEKRTN